MAMKAKATVFLFLCFLRLNTSLFRKHYYVKENMTWSKAQQYCRKNHDDLSTTSSVELNRLSANPKVVSDFYWIGLQRDAQSPTLWRWSGGETATNIMWDAGQPDTLHEQCAAVLKSNSKVHDSPCFLSVPFYCMEDFELILVQQENTWEEALEYCRQKYVDLAGLTSGVIMAQAKDKSTPALTDDVWIGLRFIAGYWFWVNGNNVVYKAWSEEDEPQCPAMDQRCGVYDRKKEVWKPADCERRLNFLCVKKSKSTPNESSN
ncbi:Lymphocyte antigen 75 [Anabarilius grahami]|uniref:Lymphocyte antigen 75 n=1 Tax=Anabarilius grahami TaxID=495550 RepID=A0A3N0YH04_ANAGA|nr:Lymphocyte antigen 75 [Anabarilius grahami]